MTMTEFPGLPSDHLDGGGGVDDDKSGSHAAQSLGDTLRWAFELDESPAIAGATFLTREIIPAARDPFDAITTSAASLQQLEAARTQDGAGRRWANPAKPVCGSSKAWTLRWGKTCCIAATNSARLTQSPGAMW